MSSTISDRRRKWELFQGFNCSEHYRWVSQRTALDPANARCCQSAAPAPGQNGTGRVALAEKSALSMGEQLPEPRRGTIADDGNLLVGKPDAPTRGEG
jgi:hypothetical protein